MGERSQERSGEETVQVTCDWLNKWKEGGLSRFGPWKNGRIMLKRIGNLAEEK